MVVVLIMYGKDTNYFRYCEKRIIFSSEKLMGRYVGGLQILVFGSKLGDFGCLMSYGEPYLYVFNSVMSRKIMSVLVNY